ncbi:Peptidase C13, legumain [Candidatus Magnetomorum sp. HK-1]|nr:Peptidase C13, legumain [Candidatus Magnetomorum sp. HK-1]
MKYLRSIFISISLIAIMPTTDIQTSVTFPDIEILSINSSDFIIDEPLKLTVTGKGFDNNSRIFMVHENSTIEIYNELNDAWDVEVVNNLAFVADGYAGLKIIDLKNPLHPVLTGTFDTQDFVKSVSVSDKTVFIAEENYGLQVIDINNLSNPIKTDTIKLTVNDIQDIELSGNIAYIANGRYGFKIIDLQNPSKLLGSVDTPGWAYGVAVKDNIAYVADSRIVLIIDVNNPELPCIIDFLDIPGRIYDVAISGEIAYVANGDRGVQIFDIRDPIKPFILSTIKTSQPAIDIAIVDDTVFIAGDHYLSELSVANIEIEDYTDTSLTLNISHPTVVGQYHLKIYNQDYSDVFDYTIHSPFFVSEVSSSLSGNSAPAIIPFHIKENSTDVSIQDYTINTYSLNQNLISNDNISLIATESSQNILHITPTTNQFGTAIIELRITNGKVYQVEDFTISVQFNDIEIFTVEPSHGLLGLPLDLTVTGKGFDKNTSAFLIPADNCEIEIFNGLSEITVPNYDIFYVKRSQGILKEPLPLTVTKKIIDYNSNAIEGKPYTIEVADCNVEIVNNSDPIYINDIFHWRQLHYVRGIEVVDNIAYIADGIEGVKIFDVNNPFDPILIGSFETEGSACGVAVTGYTIYVADGYSSLQIFDISEPSNPFFTGTVDVNDNVNDVIIVGNTALAYISYLEKGLQIIDKSNPSQTLSFVNTPDNSFAALLVGNIVYLTNSSGIQIIDVSDIRKPYFIDFIDLSDYDDFYDAYDVSTLGNIAFLAKNDGGIQVLDISNPAKPYKLATIKTKHEARGICVADNILYIVGEQSLSVLPVSNIEIEDYTESTLKLKSSPLSLPGQKHLMVYNPKSSDSEDYSILSPFLITDVSTNLPGNTGRVSIPFNFEVNNSDVSIQDYTITAKSHNQQLISNDNMSLTITESQQILQITPTINQFGTSTIEFFITNGIVSQIERFEINIQFADIEISSITPSHGMIGDLFELTVTGKGFDNNSRVIMLPKDNSNIKIYNDLASAKGIEVVNNLAYVADDSAGLKIIDVNNPFHPVLIKTIDTPGNAYGVAVTGYTVYVADNCSDIHIIDASNLSNPIITDTVDINNCVKDIIVSEDIAYIAKGSYGLHIIDILNSFQPLGFVDTPDEAYGVAVADSTVYIADDDSGIQIIDVSDFSNPYIINYLELSGYVYDIAISDDIAYVANYYRGVQILDISNPTKPYILATIKTNHPVRCLTIADDKLYIGSKQYLSVLPLANIEIENYTDTSLKLNILPLELSADYNLKVYNPQSSDIAEYSTRSFIVSEISAALSGNSAPESIPFYIDKINADASIQDYTISAYSMNQDLISDDNISLTINENQNILQITPTTNQFGFAPITLAISNGKGYQIERFPISIQFADIDISTLTPSQGLLGETLELTVTGTSFDNNSKAILVPNKDYSDIQIYSDFVNAIGIEIINNLAYVADSRAGLKIIDINNPFYPVLIKTIDTPGSASGVAVTGNTVYVADKCSDIHIIDLSNSIITDTVDINNCVNDIIVAENIAYISKGFYGLHIIDLQNSSQSLGFVDTPDYASGISLFDSLIYVADDNSGLQIIDVSDDSNPYIIDSLDLPDSVYDISISDDIAYVANNHSGIQVLDISNPTKPYILATIKTNHPARGITVADDKLYVVGEKYLSILPAVKRVEITDPIKNNLKLPASSFVQKYSIIIANPQYSDSQTITFQTPFIFEKIPDQVIYPSIEEATFPIAITSTLSETYVRNYTIIGFSGNLSMLPDDHITIKGEGKNRTLHIKTPHHQYGTMPIHLIVNDGYASIKESFNLTVKYPQLSYNYQGDISTPLTPMTFVEKGGFSYEVNTEAHCIVKINMNNGETKYWGQKGQSNGSFDQPTGIAMDEDGFIYVVDSGNNRVQVFTSYGEFITSFGELGAEKLNRPEFIYIAENGDIYISEKNNENTKIFQRADYTEGITKAIIIVGRKDPKYDSILEASRNCADLAYNALIYQGLDKNKICYLSSELDNEKVDDIATIDNIKIAITQWAKGEKTARTEQSITADSLIVYLVDHGGDGYFLVNEDENLSATVLRKWLDDLNDFIPGKLIFIYEACQSGSFIPVLSNKNINRERILITSALSNENALLGNDGAISFSNYFWAEIFNGNDIKTAFKAAQQISEFKINDMSVIDNTPQLNTNNNDHNNEDYDLNSLKNVYIGNGIQNSVAPVILDISPKQYITSSESAVITASISLPNDKISEVWTQIISKKHTQYDSTASREEIKISMQYIESQKSYKGTFKPDYNENNSGSYLAAVYAKDNNGLVSKPKLTLVTVNDPQKRCAILVMGKNSHYSIKKKAIRSLEFKQYSYEDIYVIDDNERNRYPANELGLSTAISDCIAITPKDILLYMIGDGNGTSFTLNETESLSQEQLNLMIEKIQNAGIPVTIVYDGPYADDYLFPIKDNKNCILFSSTDSEYAYFELNGLLSFSWHFWNMVTKGLRVSNIFISTKKILQTIFDKDQIPTISYGEERSKSYIIGENFSIASDTPNIESISPKQTLLCKNSAEIFAHNITGLNKIDKVVALIFPPEDLPQLMSKPELVQLNKIESTDDYCTTYNNFSFSGEYYISICAIDTLGNISNPLTTTILKKTAIDSIMSVLEVLTGIESNNPITPVVDINNDLKVGLKEAIYLMQCRENNF